MKDIEVIMKESVKFIFVENIIEIDNYGDYLNKKIDILMEKFDDKKIDYYFDEIDNEQKEYMDNNQFVLTVNYEEKKQCDIFFEFETFGQIKQLEVSIYCEDIESEKFLKYEKNTLIETLKVKLKDIIMYKKEDKKEREWENCVWILDYQSQKFATELYNKIYETENLFRNLISELMLKAIGVNWWEDVVNKTIKDEHKERSGSYKSIVPAFNDVDERLLSVDATKLSQISKSKIYKWNFKEDDYVCDILRVYIENNQNLKIIKEKEIKEVFKKISNQFCVEVDLWEKYFSKYLSDDFLDNYKKFSKDRNHIAHNKIIDRDCYEKINENIIQVSKEINNAIEKVKENYKSIEKIDLERQKYNDYKSEIIEEQTGIELIDEDEIIERFDEATDKIYEAVEDSIRFREDLEIGDKFMLEETIEEKELFTIKHLITEEEIKIKYILFVDETRGALSTLKIIYENIEGKKIYCIEYSNGDYEYDDEQGLYMPILQSEFSEEKLELAIQEIIDNINKDLVNLKERVDNTEYDRVKNGEKRVVLEIPCWSCGECYICINEEYGPINTCLVCGEKIDIKECSRCGEYTDEINALGLCPFCQNKFESE